MQTRLEGYLPFIPITQSHRKYLEDPYQNAKSLMESLGFVTNLEKSQAIATQKMEFLDFIIDSFSMTFRLPLEKLMEIMQKYRCALQQPLLTTIRDPLLKTKLEYTFV